MEKKKKTTKKVSKEKCSFISRSPESDIAYLMHRIVANVERMNDGRPIMHAELQVLHQDIDLLLKNYISHPPLSNR